MLITLSRLLTTAADPSVFALVCFAAGLAFFFALRKARAAAAFFLCGSASLLLFSSPIVSFFLIRGLEGRYTPPADFAPAAAVVLLGGSTTGKIPPRIHVEINHAGNRILHAVRVFRSSGTPHLVLTGGLLEGISDEVISEAEAMFELINELFGVDSADVIIENKAQNTRDNAVFTKRAMEEAGLGNNIILVTSAYHMPRSAAVFKKAGFEVTPAPTGYHRHEFMDRDPPGWLPGSRALFESSIAIREYLGLAIYKIVGWI